MDDRTPIGRGKQCVLCQNSIAPLNSYVLRCLHIACASCIESSKELSIFCANCDLSTSIEELKKRLLYLNDEFSRCDCNDKGLVITRCVECEEFLCLACEIAHRRVKLSKNHQLIQIRGSSSFADPETISFCKTCNQKTEPSCETSMHFIRKFLPVSIEDQNKIDNAIDEEYLNNLRQKNDGCVERIAQCRKEELVMISNQINNAMKADIDSIDSETTIVHSKNLRNQIISFSAMPHFADIALPMLNEAENILSERLDQKYVANAKKNDLNSMKNHILSILNAISVSSSPEYGTANEFDAGSNEGHSEQGPVEKIIPNSFNTKKNFIASTGAENSSENKKEIPMDVNVTIMKLDYVGPATSAEPELLDQNQPSSFCGSKKRKRSFHVANGKSTPPLRLRLRLTGIDGLTIENEGVRIENRQNHVDANNIPNEEVKVGNSGKELLEEACDSEKEEIVNILDVSGGSLNSLTVIDPLMEKENLESRQVNNHNETKSSTQAQVGNDGDEKEWDTFCSVCGKSDQPLAHCHAAMCLRSFHFDHHVPPVFHEDDKFVCSLCNNVDAYKTADDVQPNEKRKSSKMTKYEKKAAEQILLKLYCDPDSMLLGYHEDCNLASLPKEISLSYVRDRLISTTFPRTSSSSSVDSSGPLMSTPKNPSAVLHLDATPNAIGTGGVSKLPGRPKYDRIEAFIFDMNQLFVESFKRYGDRMTEGGAKQNRRWSEVRASLEQTIGEKKQILITERRDQSTYMQQCEQMASVYMKTVNDLLPLYRHHVDLSMPNERNLRKKRGTKVQSDFEISK